MKNMKVTTTYRESGILLDRVGNVCRVRVGCEIRFIHASKVFLGGKSFAK